MRNSHHLLTHYIVCFRCLTSGRELPKIPANQVKFAQFASRSRELRKFRAFRVKIHPYLVTSFRSLTIDREPQKIGANRPDFAQFAHNSHELHEIRRIHTHDQNTRSESRELQKCTANDASSAPFAQRTSK